MIRIMYKTFGYVGATVAAAVAIPLVFSSSAFAQNPEASPGARATGAAAAVGQPSAAVPPEPTAGGTAEAARVVVTGSNIPTAEETGPNPVDTYRPTDIEKLGIRNATDLQEFIPQEAGGTVNLNIGNGGDGTIRFNLRGLLPKETLVLLDGKRLAGPGLGGGPADINLIPFAIIDHLDILKDGASAVYGSDAVAGVVNYFLIHKFRGLEIYGSYGNSNMGASNEMGEWEAYIKAGTGDDKTDIVVIADFWQRLGGIFSRDRDVSSNGFFIPFGGFEVRSGNFPGRVAGSRLVPKMFFGPGGLPQPGVNTPVPHSAPDRFSSPFYISLFSFSIYTPVFGVYPDFYGGGDYFFFNFARFTPDLPPGDRQTYYGSFTRDICDKYLVAFADFKYTRSFFDSSLAAVPFTPDPFKNPDGTILSQTGISVPIQNAWNPFTEGNATWVAPTGELVPVVTGVRFRGINDTGPRHEKFTYWDQLFDVGLRGEMGEFGDYFKTWNWETGFRYNLNEGQDLSVGEVSQPGLRDALLDTNPATAFDPFLNFNAHNTKAARARVYVTLHNSGLFELPLYYANINGDIFNLPAGPLSFAVGGEYHGERFDRDRDVLNTTFNSIGSVDGQSFKVNRDVWGVYEELRIPVTSPTWNFIGAYSLEFDVAEREEWFSNNTSAVLPIGFQPFVPAGHSRYNAQKPKFSVRWEPLDPKWIGALTLRGSYSEAFHAPTIGELSPASGQSFPLVVDPFSSQTEPQVEERQIGNPNLHPEVAYEWTYGAVYSPKWLKGLTMSADFWHIDMRDITTLLGAQFIISHNLPGLVFRGPSEVPGEPGPVTLVIDPDQNLAGAVFEGVDFETVYILDTAMFGAGDFGRVTATANGTYLSRARLQVMPDTKPFGIAGEFLSSSFTLTSSLPRWRANFSLFYDGPADTWMQGFDVGAIVHYISDYHDDDIDLIANTPPFVAPKPQTPLTDPTTGLVGARTRQVRDWTTLDLIASYTFNLPPPAPTEVPGLSKEGGKNVKMKDGKEKNVMPVSTAEYNPCGFRAWLNQTTIQLGMQNVFDQDPPFVAGSFENGYDESLTNIKGRFWYVSLKKVF